MSDENLHSMTGAYTLDALEPAEREAFEAHLATCAECRDEVAGLSAAVARLADVVATAPPPALRGRVLAQAATTAQTPPTPQAPPVAPPVAAPVAPAVAPPFAAPAVPPAALSAAPPGAPAVGAPGTAATRRPAVFRRSGSSRPPAGRRRLVAAVAAALLLVVGGAAGGTLAVRDHRAAQVAMAAQAHMMRIATAPDAVSHDVALGTSHVVMSVEMSAAALVGQDVPMPSRQGAVYQLWMVHADGSTAPGPTFTPQHGEVLAIAEGDLAAVTALRVTEEPGGGSTAPTGAVVVSVAL